ncbi:unnamed protein product, partial [Meganyctiphanes norvegica]
MLDLRKERNFEKYIMYITEPQKSLESWVENYVSDYCMKRNSEGKSILGIEANDIFIYKVTQLIECVKKKQGNNEISFEVWLKKFNKAAEEIISLSDTLFNMFDMKEVEVKDMNYFRTEIIKSLETLKTSQETVLDNWNLKELNSVNKPPHTLICDSILGCMMQCPMCYVICSCTIEHPGKKHTAPRHYPQALSGMHNSKTKKLDLESCNELMLSDRSFGCPDSGMKYVKYKNYKSVNKYYASWSIAADNSLEPSLY